MTKTSHHVRPAVKVARGAISNGMIAVARLTAPAATRSTPPRPAAVMMIALSLHVVGVKMPMSVADDPHVAMNWNRAPAAQTRAVMAHAVVGQHAIPTMKSALVAHAATNSWSGVALLAAPRVMTLTGHGAVVVQRTLMTRVVHRAAMTARATTMGVVAARAAMSIVSHGVALPVAHGVMNWTSHVEAPLVGRAVMSSTTHALARRAARAATTIVSHGVAHLAAHGVTIWTIHAGAVALVAMTMTTAVARVDAATTMMSVVGVRAATTMTAHAAAVPRSGRTTNMGPVSPHASIMP